MNEDQFIEALGILNNALVVVEEKMKTLEETVGEQSDNIDMIIIMLENLGK